MLIYKLLSLVEWAEFESSGKFAGSADDLRDGFIHLSAADQVEATRTKYFADVPVMRLTLDADALGSALRWEVSRGGAEFPHLYRLLARAEIVAVTHLP